MPRAYDRAITIFSPEGRLYHVEYAHVLVKRGAPIVGVSCSHGAVLAANETPESNLEDPEYFKKIYQLDDHVASAIAGLSSDATGSKVLTTDPSGAYRGFKATAVGRKSEEANKLLEEKYGEDMSIDDAARLAVDA